jgi:hypothetical protein
VRARRAWPGHALYDRIEYLWHALCREPLYRVLAVALALLSVVTVWSEITFFADNPVLSVRTPLAALIAKLGTYTRVAGLGPVN